MKNICILVLLTFFILSGCGSVKEQDSAPPDTGGQAANVDEIVEIPLLYTEDEVIPKDTVTISFVSMTGSSPQVLIDKEEEIFLEELKRVGKKLMFLPPQGLHGLQEVYPIMDRNIGNPDFVYLPQTAFSTYPTKSTRFGGSDKYVIVAGSNSRDEVQLIAKPGIESFQDLDGKKVGIANLRYADEYQLEKILASVGLSTVADGGTVEIIWDDIVSKLWENYADGKYDAIIMFGAHNVKKVLELVPDSKLLSLNPDGMFGERQPRLWLVAKKELIKENPEVVKAVLKAHVLLTDKANERIAEIPAINREVRMNYYLELGVLQEQVEEDNPLEIFEKGWKNSIITYDPNYEYVKNLFEHMIEKKYLNPQGLEDFIKIDLLNEVLRELNKPTVN